MRCVRWLRAARTTLLKPSLRPQRRWFHASQRVLGEDTVVVNIDGKDVEVNKNFSILQACEDIGIHIPRFCYHERLSIAGNCRMCMVEVERAPKPVAACAAPLMPGMVIKTDSEKAKFARRGVIELLLINHPRDCPICDQASECDLQDQSYKFGSPGSRFTHLDKRVVEDKDLGPFVSTSMSRCIHCSRCIRFLDEIAGTRTLGMLGRGSPTEIGTYVKEVIDSELSGNLYNVCPVGALNSKPTTMQDRPRVMRADIMDSVGSNITVDTAEVHLYRIMPRTNDEINEEVRTAVNAVLTLLQWISDKTRYSHDGVSKQRLDAVLVRDEHGEFKQVTWREAFHIIRERLAGLKGDAIKAIAGDLCDVESMLVLKEFMARLGSSNLESAARVPAVGFFLPVETFHREQACADLRADYLFNSTIVGLEEADLVLLIGTNPRMEAAMVNARILKANRNENTEVALLGPACELNYTYTHLGDSMKTLDSLVDGTHEFSARLHAAKRPVVVLGRAALSSSQGEVTHAAFKKLATTYPQLMTEDHMGLNVLHTDASAVGALDIGFVQGVGKPSPPEFVYLLGADEWEPDSIPEDAFVVYQGHHGERGAARADVVLPSCTWLEKNGTYVNMEGRAQRGYIALTKLPEARPVGSGGLHSMTWLQDWGIVCSLAEFVGLPLGYGSLKDVRTRLEMVAPHLLRVCELETPLFHPFVNEEKAAPLPEKGFPKAYSNFFATNVVTRASPLFARSPTLLPMSTNSYREANNH